MPKKGLPFREKLINIIEEEGINVAELTKKPKLSSGTLTSLLREDYSKDIRFALIARNGIIYTTL